MKLLWRLIFEELEALNEREPDWFPNVVAKIASGGSALEEVQKRKWPYGPFRAWVKADSARSRMWEDALEDREDYRREVVEQQVMDIAMTTPEEVNAGNVLKAAEMIRGANLMLPDRFNGGTMTEQKLLGRIADLLKENPALLEQITSPKLVGSGVVLDQEKEQQNGN